MDNFKLYGFRPYTDTSYYIINAVIKPDNTIKVKLNKSPDHYFIVQFLTSSNSNIQLLAIYMHILWYYTKYDLNVKICLTFISG